MMDLVVSTHSIEEPFWELPSCFYTRNLDLEEVHCVPYTEARKENVIGNAPRCDLINSQLTHAIRDLLLPEVSGV